MASYARGLGIWRRWWGRQRRSFRAWLRTRYRTRYPSGTLGVQPQHDGLCATARHQYDSSFAGMPSCLKIQASLTEQKEEEAREKAGRSCTLRLLLRHGQPIKTKVGKGNICKYVKFTYFDILIRICRHNVYMQVCICICMYIYVYIYKYIYMCVCVRVRWDTHAPSHRHAL